jgi:hypothetical protein
MKFKIEQGNELINSVGGISLVGKILEMCQMRTHIMKNAQGTPLQRCRIADVLVSWIGLASQAKTNFEDIELFREDEFFKSVFGLKNIYSSSRFRQIMEEIADDEIEEVVKNCNLSLLKGKTFGTIKIGEHYTDLIPCDLDVSPFDNSKSSKEFVSRTYKGHDGYAPMFAYIGTEGFMLNSELRPGKQHCQKGTELFLYETIDFLKELGILDRVIFRMDSGNDAAANIRILNKAGVRFIIKRNPRKEVKLQWLDTAKSLGEGEEVRPGKTVYTGSTSHIQPAGFTQQDIPVEIAFEITERSIDKNGQMLLINNIELATYWTNIGEATSSIVWGYHNHGTSEQFHSELKTDLDVERLPSGKFRVNSLILTLSMCAFNALREIGMKMLDFKEDAPVKMNVQRKRMSSVLRDMIYIGCKMVKHSGSLILKFGRNCKWFELFKRVYLSYC